MIPKVIEDRWMQFKRFGEERVLQIHALERAADCLCSEIRCAAGWQLVQQFNRELGPYWGKTKTQADAHKETEAFLAFVRPIAIAARQKAVAEGAKSGPALHAADLAVIRADYKINYGPGAPSKILSKVYAKGGQDRAAGREDDDHLDPQEKMI